MNVKSKTALDVINKILAVILAITLVVLIYVVVVKYPGGATVEAKTEAAAGDTIKIDELVPDTYGGIELKTTEDVVNYYVKAYDYTKSLTADYTDADGNKVQYYKLLGDEDLQVQNILVEGQSNAMIDGLVPGILKGVFSGSVFGLVPCCNRDPNLDVSDDGQYDFKTSSLVADDVLACNAKDNGDGTITLQIQPKEVEMSVRGADAQGHFFESLGDIAPTVEKISILTFSEGGINDNFKVKYQGGVGTVTIDTATGEITTADYEMDVHIDVTHACVKVIKDKSASLDIVYKNHFPASDEFLKTAKGITRA